MTMLPKIAKAVDGACKIIVDGGFLRGADICKGICAGADIIAMGRFVALGMAAGGEESLVRAFDLLLVRTKRNLWLLPSSRAVQIALNLVASNCVLCHRSLVRVAVTYSRRKCTRSWV